MKHKEGIRMMEATKNHQFQGIIFFRPYPKPDPANIPNPPPIKAPTGPATAPIDAP
jgi:hypothetical protein